MFHKSKMIFAAVFIAVALGGIYQSYAMKDKLNFNTLRNKKLGTPPIESNFTVGATRVDIKKFREIYDLKDKFAPLFKECAKIL